VHNFGNLIYPLITEITKKIVSTMTNGIESIKRQEIQMKYLEETITIIIKLIYMAVPKH
jgi:CII-binding regulator of phage lambda lysogenization HflD